MIFSERTQWDLDQNSITKAIDELKSSKREMFDLTQSNPTLCSFSFPSKEILNAFVDDDNLSYGPDSQGILKAREAISDYYAKKNVNVDPANIFLTASTSEGYSLLFKLLANPQDSILFPQPSYPLFQFLCDINDVLIQYYPLVYNGRWQVQLNQMQKDENFSQAKAFVIVNPNNPTGSIISTQELTEINQFCKKNNMAIICDEVFADFLFKGTQGYVTLSRNEEVLTFTLGGLSKTLGLPQMKLSWILMSGPKEFVGEAKGRLQIISDTYLSVNTPVQNALKNLLSEADVIQSQINQRVDQNIQSLKKLLGGFQKVSYLNSEGGWYFVLKILGLQNEEKFILDLIQEEQVLVHPGYFYDFAKDGYIVLSLIVPNRIFVEGLGRILKRVNSL